MSTTPAKIAPPKDAPLLPLNTTAVMEPPVVKAPAVSVPEGSPIQNIPIDKILRSPWNRNSEPNEELIASIRQHGVLENLILRPIVAGLDHMNKLPNTVAVAIGDTIYELVAGERRWKAAKKAGRSHVPAAVRNLTDLEAMNLQIEENEQRQDYSPMERAEAYNNLRLQFMEAHKGEKSFTAEKAIELVAKSRKCETRIVYSIISLKTKLHYFVQCALNQGELLASHAYEIAPRPEEEQIALLKWLRQETQHSQGDIPSVRRLKREIQAMDIAADEKRRQEKLFKDPQPGTATSKVPTVDEQLYSKAVGVVQEMHLHRMVDPLFLQRNLKIEPAVASALFVRMEKEGIVGPKNTHGERSYIFPKPAAQLIHRLHTNTLTTEDEKKLKTPTAAQLKKEAAAQDKFERNAAIEKKYQSLFFAALAKKAQINSRFLTHIIPGLFAEAADLPIPFDEFAQSVLGWPAPKQSRGYDLAELSAHAKKHTRKYTPGLLAALVTSLHVNESHAKRLAKYFGVGCKRLRKLAEAAVPKKGEK